MDDVAQKAAAVGQVDWGQTTLEDRVLKMVAKVAQSLEDFA
jgi:hypothetical protein